MKRKLLLVMFMVAITMQAYPQCYYDTLAVSNHQNGQLMRTFHTPGPSLDLSFLQPGIYLLVIESSGKVTRRIKMIKVG